MTGLLAVDANGLPTTLVSGLSTVVPAGGSASIPTSPGTGGLVVDYTLAADDAAIAAQRVYLEDLHTLVTVVDDVQWGTTGFTKVDLTFRLDADTDSIQLSMPPTVQIDIVQPLAADRGENASVLHITHVTHGTDGTTSSPVESVVDLSKGVIFSLTELLHGGS